MSKELHNQSVKHDKIGCTMCDGSGDDPRSCPYCSDQNCNCCYVGLTEIEKEDGRCTYCQDMSH